MRLVLGSFVSLILLSFSSEAFAISSTFDVDKEGWFVENRDSLTGFSLKGTQAATYVATMGNPGGHICCADTTAYSDFFAAPSPYLGDKTSFIDGTLTFDVKSQGGAVANAPFLVLLEGNGEVLFFNSGFTVPLGTWVSLSVSLGPASGWKVATGNCFFSNTCGTAGSSDFQNVMSNLTSLNIRGDWINGADTGRLDNVNMVPEPSALLLIAGGLLALGLNGARQIHDR